MAIAPSDKREHRLITLEGSFPKSDKVYFAGARVTEALNKLTETRIEFISDDTAFDIGAVVGKTMTLSMETAGTTPRKFHGTCISIEHLGQEREMSFYAADVRPWLWFLTCTKDSRVFQNMTAPDIIKKVFNDMGFSDFRTSLSGSYLQREYCIQYGETSYDFVCRLMEEEGITYYFDHSGAKEVLVLGDSISAHSPIKETPELEFKRKSQDGQMGLDHVFEWGAKRRVTPGKVTLVNYNMMTPASDLKVSAATAKGSHGHANYEVYDMTGRYKELSHGETIVKQRMEAAAHGAELYAGASNARTLAVGSTFKLKGAPMLSATTEFLVLSATHFMKAAIDKKAEKAMEDMSYAERIEFPEGMANYQANFEVGKKAEPFRPQITTASPKYYGITSAIVTGPSGEEVYPDPEGLGRIKVQFAWDRVGGKDDQSSCWVRVALPWTGNGYGMYAIPRIGQEVIIQFTNGDPDYPVCIGMVYNGVNAHPYPADLGNYTGIKTNSTKGGGGFHELHFDDTKGEELIRFQSEKDFHQLVKNNAAIRIGLKNSESLEKGDLLTIVHHDSTEVVETGDKFLLVETGSRTTSIKTDDTLAVEGKSAIKIDGDSTLLIGGDSVESVEGKRGTKVKGNEGLVVDGNIMIKSKGKITLDAANEILLKVGSTTIKITKTGIVMKTTKLEMSAKMVKMAAVALLDITGKVAKLAADAILTVKGALTKIN